MFKFNKYLRGVLITWIPLAVVITLLCGLVHVTVQQNYRMSANDPQIQLAEDVATEVENGQSPTAFVPTRKLDLENTLATYILIFDDKGKIIGSSVTLDNKNPVIPSGVFDTTKKQGETKFTWQPKEGVRSALVVKYYKGQTPGFVAVGRSIREVEKREQNLLLTVFAAWLVTMATSFISVYFLQKFK